MANLNDSHRRRWRVQSPLTRLDRAPLARELARVRERQDAIAALLAGFYASEGLAVPAVLIPARPASCLARNLRRVQ